MFFVDEGGVGQRSLIFGFGFGFDESRPSLEFSWAQHVLPDPSFFADMDNLYSEFRAVLQGNQAWIFLPASSCLGSERGLACD